MLKKLILSYNYINDVNKLQISEFKYIYKNDIFDKRIIQHLDCPLFLYNLSPQFI